MNKLFFGQVVINNRNSERFGTRQNFIISSPNEENARKELESWRDRYDEVTSLAEIKDAVDTDETPIGSTYIKFID